MAGYLEFCAIGDLHLEKLATLFKDMPEVDHVGMQLSTVERALNYAVDRGIRTVVQVGDMFDTPFPSQDTLTRVLTLLARQKYRKLRIVILLGNHDFHREGVTSQRITEFISTLNGMNHIRMVSRTMGATLDGVKCWFASWPETAAPPGYPLAFGHMAVNGAKADSGYVFKHGGAVMDGKGPWWVLGDFHTFQVNRQGRYLYIGTPVQLSFGESGRKGFLHGRFGTTLEYKMIPVTQPYRLINVKVETDADLERPFNEPDTYYKIFVRKGVVLPQGWLLANPRIVKHVGYRSDDEAKTLASGGVVVPENVHRQLHPTHGLGDYLKRQGLSDAGLKRAKLIMQEVLVELKGQAREAAD